MPSWLRVVAGLLVVGQLSGCASGGGLSENGRNILVGAAVVAAVAGMVLLSKDSDDDDDYRDGYRWDSGDYRYGRDSRRYDNRSPNYCP
ncbi:hypothetical protein [Pseudomonas nitroreducens]|uniref:hypothetical protein n=1 Tax=Pseudomonas nitroreducens TaxID=46680 RepID=UPI00265B4234|nr:hypothetical protein [Pseudomonas nitroreducens]MCP1651720.1 hypothetical protein [Pseudomonas nitroreducens]MCP1684415.1 hypothetical protein [Pseudomonas nitroreducens]